MTIHTYIYSVLYYICVYNPLYTHMHVAVGCMNLYTHALFTYGPLATVSTSAPLSPQYECNTHTAKLTGG